jgi:hypothetical protein
LAAFAPAIRPRETTFLHHKRHDILSTRPHATLFAIVSPPRIFAASRTGKTPAAIDRRNRSVALPEHDFLPRVRVTLHHSCRRMIARVDHRRQRMRQSSAKDGSRQVAKRPRWSAVQQSGFRPERFDLA